MKNITEDNKLIAEFMGVIITKKTLFKDDKNIETLIVDVYSKPEFFNEEFLSLFGWMSYESPNHMLYCSSWDWRMKVIEKIELLKCKINGRFGVHISSNNCSIYSTKIHLSNKTDKYFDDVYEDTKDKSTDKAIVNFIKWYNKQEHD